MKLTKEQTDKLHELAFADVQNKDIAQQLGIPVAEVYAHRSRMGITRDKVARAKTSVLPARKPAILNPEFEAAVQDMVKPKGVRCFNCAHWACYSTGSANVMPKCNGFITKEDRRKDYLYDRKQEFLSSACRSELAIGDDAYDRIKALLDELIPDIWGNW